jgi:hypothetical protein
MSYNFTYVSQAKKYTHVQNQGGAFFSIERVPFFKFWVHPWLMWHKNPKPFRVILTGK